MARSKPPIIIVDADAIVAQAYPKDSNHKHAVAISERLLQANAQLVYPVTAVTEAVTVLQSKLNSGATAFGTAVLFAQPQVSVVEVSQKTFRDALQYFSPTTSKRNTIFDCIVVSLAKKYRADAIFSFDKFYKSHGIPLASELF